MKLIQRANKQLRVADDRAEDYLKAGYIEIDPKTGKPVGEKKADKPKGKQPKDEGKQPKDEGKQPKDEGQQPKDE